tara:strand:+ start:5170 stop:6144 length:975 start_codon:yes stop_codon:yes gene_type:complete
MKKVDLFEGFFSKKAKLTKKEGQKLDKEDFADIEKGAKVVYKGDDHEVIDNDGITIDLKSKKNGKTYFINFNMFNKLGAIEEAKVEEGVNDPGILKAFFMAGGPGSGKSFVATEIFDFPKGAVSTVSYATGLKLVNNDNAFERNIKKAGYDIGKLADYAKDPEVWSEVMSLRDKAKGTTKRMQDNYISGRLGQVIDGTGKDFNKIKGHRQLYKDLGYDTYMVFVNTSLDVALERNQMRDRKLPDNIVKDMWKAVQDNLGKFSEIFGSENIIIVDNSSYDDSKSILDNIEKQIMKKVNMPVKNHLGKRWISDNSAKNKDRNKPFK